MRRIAMFNRSSADGYCAAANGSIDWIVPDADFGRSAGEAIERAAVDTVEAMKQQSGKDIMVFGSGTIVSLLATHALIDEYRLLISPVLLGQGRRLMDGLPPITELELAGVMRYESGNVMLHYCFGRRH